jgi:hypothetical protein
MTDMIDAEEVEVHDELTDSSVVVVVVVVDKVVVAEAVVFAVCDDRAWKQ